MQEVQLVNPSMEVAQEITPTGGRGRFKGGWPWGKARKNLRIPVSGTYMQKQGGGGDGEFGVCGEEMQEEGQVVLEKENVSTKCIVPPIMF
jgi:hypothetical protein